MQRTIVLHGSLKEKFGSSFKVDADTLPMLTRGIEVQAPGFLKAVRQGRYKVRVNGQYIKPEMAQMVLGQKAKRIDITPAVQGSGSGWGKAIIGAVIIGIAIVASGGTLAAPLMGMASTAFTVGGAAVTWGNIAMLGFAMAAAGVSMAMSPMPSGSTAGAGAEQRASFIFNGATNVSEQGGPIPVAYGEFRVGSVVVSVDVSTEEVPTDII